MPKGRSSGRLPKDRILWWAALLASILYVVAILGRSAPLYWGDYLRVGLFSLLAAVAAGMIIRLWRADA